MKTYTDEELKARGWHRQCGRDSLPWQRKEYDRTFVTTEVHCIESLCDARVAEALEAERKRWSAAMKLLGDDVAFIGSRDGVLCLLLNDVFNYACADAEPTKQDEWEELLRIYKAHGDLGLVAWAAIRRGSEPLQAYRTPKYLEAAAAIRAMIQKEKRK